MKSFRNPKSILLNKEQRMWHYLITLFDMISFSDPKSFSDILVFSLVENNMLFFTKENTSISICK